MQNAAGVFNHLILYKDNFFFDEVICEQQFDETRHKSVLRIHIPPQIPQST